MRSTPLPVGNVNMRGKKEKVLSCGCCVARDLRENERKKEDKREMSRALIDNDKDTKEWIAEIERRGFVRGLEATSKTIREKAWTGNDGSRCVYLDDAEDAIHALKTAPQEGYNLTCNNS